MKKRPDGTWSRTTSWTVVPDLYAFYSKNHEGYSSTSKSNIISNVKSGDVIQFKKDGADR
ncbi:amidase domain-containing protein [Lysinibacillus sp. JNUCC 51]|nr:amidase domain-containing protein [Lysinibacillus sp. JNUCC-51]